MTTEKSATTGGKPFDVFVSHSSKDNTQANLLWKELEKRGYQCWIAPESIKPGEDLLTAIRQGVENSRVLALLFNGNSDESDEVRTELYFAKKQNAPIVSIRLEPISSDYKLESFLWDKQWISADNGSFSNQVERVAAEIGTLLKSGRADLSSNPVAVSEETGAFRNIVSKVAGVAGAARLPQLPKRDSSAPETDDAGDVAAIESAMKFRGVRQSRLFNAIRAGALDVEATDKRGRTALHYAADAGELNIITMLLERGADINAADAEGLSPLHLALDDDGEAARLLLLRGADVTAKTNAGFSPLDCAINQKKTAAKNLFDLWSGIAHGYKSANDALKAGFVASHRYRAQNITDAIAAGADDLTLTDAKGRSALHWAAREAKLELVERLLNNGADARATDEDGKTPAELARAGGKSGAQEVILMLNGWENG